MKKIIFFCVCVSLLFFSQLKSVEAAVEVDKDGLLRYARSVPEYQVTDQTVDQLEPAILTMYGVRLFAEGKKEEAIYWYWLGRLRQQMLVAPLDRGVMLPDEMIIRLFREGGYRGDLLIRSTKSNSKGMLEVEKMSVLYSLEVPNRFVLIKFSYNLEIAYFKGYETENLDQFMEILNQVFEHEKINSFDPIKLIGYPSSFTGERWVKNRKEALNQHFELLEIIRNQKVEIEKAAQEGLFKSIFELKIDPDSGNLIVSPDKNQWFFLLDI